ncbi:MAG: CRISPR system precrRNA processing endoribonuclease RAMP protein Cas6 [Gammaproteobacteria bacterium]|nr:CRISPR system precrRNA processing endoribonuclease RAMP protein Cas6 [Gammaproteobacteria bacterium]MBU1655991.1 CRISPR system precrRNA processing endoribonuclease RAMP protein Cas6 [Gammaproteobacteria bacterium]MBU1962575.1 CRISPR system precrRNA processing endoribonuclease RAMP protein Cas6 [Gammaproteobacteria bacterium]
MDRYSSRQAIKHKIGGILGSVTLDRASYQTAWPLLWHGQFLHLGKLTSMGHGAYRIRLPDGAPTP